MYDRKYIFGDKSTFSRMVITCPKKSTRKYIFCKLNKGQLPTVLI